MPYSEEAKQGISIYGLYDSNGCLRYIGKANNPIKRLKGHMQETRRKTPLYDWLKKHGKPEIKILEENCTDWRASEKMFIKKARYRGERLLNVADGGDEPYCPTDVRASNGRKTANAIHSCPSRKRFWTLRHQLGIALRQGAVSEATKIKMRRAAIKYPNYFGDWAII